MPLVVEPRTRGGRIVRGIPDPSGGTFDAAGDFDQLLDDDSYPTIRQVDPFGVSTLGSAALPSLLADITAALQKARPGVETRGLLRLRRLAELCLGDRELRLVVVGD